MDAVQSGPLALALSFVLGVALASGALFMWLSRQIAALKLRLQQVDHARLQGAQQLTQARKQIEQLQRECQGLRLALRPSARPARPEPAPAPVDAAEAARQHVEALLNRTAPAPNLPQAFKDTIVQRRDTE